LNKTYAGLVDYVFLLDPDVVSFSHGHIQIHHADLTQTKLTFSSI